MIHLLLSLLLSVPETTVQDAPPQDPGTAVADIDVRQRRIEDPVADFVAQVAAPNHDRSLARWTDRVCVGTVNLRGETAQYLVDRVSTVAEDLGLRIGEPGCRANIVIVATDAPDEVALAMTTENRRVFRAGGPGMDAGEAALERFQRSDRPVRWWSVSMPTEADTGAPAVRLQGQCTAPCFSDDPRFDNLYTAPILNVSASRMDNEIVDNIQKVIVVLDVDQLAEISVVQLADYVAMVSLAQVDPEADTRQHDTILNIFDDPRRADQLTSWDLGYLEALYESDRDRPGARQYQREIAESIRKAESATASPQ